MYADDLVIYYKVDEREVVAALKYLQSLCDFSGQEINFHKLSIHLSQNLKPCNKHNILRILQMAECDHNNSYLGIPFCKGHMKHTGLSEIADKVKRRLASWKAKVLSFARRGILVRPIAQTIPTYVMQTHLLPTKLCNRIDGMICDF